MCLIFILLQFIHLLLCHLKVYDMKTLSLQFDKNATVVYNKSTMQFCYTANRLLLCFLLYAYRPDKSNSAQIVYLINRQSFTWALTNCIAENVYQHFRLIIWNTNFYTKLGMNCGIFFSKNSKTRKGELIWLCWSYMAR